MVWVLDDEEGVWPWSVFWNGEVEQGRRRGTGEIENHNLVCCILGFYVFMYYQVREKKNQDFCSLSFSA